MVVLSIIALLVVLAAPSFSQIIVMQRLRGVNAQFITDMQFARSEAVARSRDTRVNLATNGTQSCYVIYIALDGVVCDCTLGAGAACNGTTGQELRTVTVPLSGGVSAKWPPEQDTKFGFDRVTGGLVSLPNDSNPLPLASVQVEWFVDNARLLRNVLVQSGRPTVCAPNSTVMQVTACPPP